MPEANEFDQFDGDNDDDGSTNVTEIRAFGRRAEKRANKLERENEELRAQIAGFQRQTAFTSAGLNLSEKQQTALLAAHGDTDLTADSLMATAIELGFAQAPDETAEDQARENALQGQARIAASQAGSTSPEPVPDIDQQIFAAETNEDWATAMALKAQKVAQLAGMG